MRHEPAVPHVILYTKAGCHLCDDARSYLDDLSAEYAFLLDEIDIRRDDVLFERYRYRIPVIVIDGVEQAEGRIDREDLREAFASKRTRYGRDMLPGS